MSREPVLSVLSDALVDAIKGRRVKTAVFLTFQFDPGFFEDELLPLLFDQSFSHVPQIRLVQLEERIRSLENLVVYYDRRGLTPDARPARLDYRRVGLQRSTGYFHPKNIFLLIENQEGDVFWDSLLIATLSANLTRSGWWENVEVAYITEVRSGNKCTFRNELLRLISQLKKEDTIPEDKHHALESVRKFLVHNIGESGKHKKQGLVLPHLYRGQSSLPEFLNKFVDPDTYNLEIISPYFDDRVNSKTLDQFIDLLQPRMTRAYLPRAADGSAECKEALFNHLNQLPQVRWGVLPASVTQMGSGLKSEEFQRFVHAKVYRFWNQEREILFIGSANLTSAAHSPVNSGNFETGILVEVEVTGQQGWWLQPVITNLPTEFRDPLVEDMDDTATPCNVTIRFDWSKDILSYYWEKPGAFLPGRAEVLTNNVTQFSINPIRFDKWARLPAEVAQEFKKTLESNSLVEVRVDDGSSLRVLVREDGMAHKPALLLFLTPEEILHYWSLLSPEQREHFLAGKALADIDGYAMRKASPLKHNGDSMFDRFAGIFHAFGRLEKHVREALATNHESEAVYRLLGEKHDSLPSLIDKIIAEEDAERVHRYVTLLCAKQLLDGVEKDFPDFKSQHRQAFKHVRDKFSALDDIEAGFTFETPEVRSEFFTWFKEMFLKPARLPESEDVS